MQGKAKGNANSTSVSQQKNNARATSGTPMQNTLLQMQRSFGNQATTRYLSGQIQRKAAQRSPLEEEEELQLKQDPAQRMPEEEELQMKRSAPMQMQSAGANRMPEDVQMKMEQAFQADFSDVKIHEGSRASDVGALAYAQGNDIHFAQGKFEPHSQSGQELLGHELAHVVQQRQGRVQPTSSINGLAVNDDPALEQEADLRGRQAASLKLEEE